MQPMHLFSQTATDSNYQQIYKITISPNDRTLIVKDVIVEPEELRNLRQSHNGLNRGPITPCINDTGTFSKKYLRIQEIKEVELDIKNITPNTAYGISHHFPKSITGINGETFKASGVRANSKHTQWGACRQDGSDGFPFWVHTLQAQAFQFDTPLIIETKRIKTIKHLTFLEFEQIKDQQLDLLLKINNTNDINELRSIVEANKFTDIIGVTKLASKKIKEKEDELNAPLIEAQRRRFEEQEKLRIETNKRIEETLNQFRKNLGMGSETNCGPILEIKGDLLKIYAPIANFGNEHWIRKSQIFPPDTGCRFHNGNYIGR
jgi:hypothetical protein